MAEYKTWDTFRTVCGRGRITYHPEWSPKSPWASYINGTALCHFVSVDDAGAYFKKKGMCLDLTKKT